MGDHLGGRLLVAGPRLVDPNFVRTVVFVCRHDDEGALGLVINRPTALPVAEALPGWVEVLAPPNVIFLGGPVQPEMAVALALLTPPQAGREDSDAWTPIDDRLGLLNLSAPPVEEVGSLEQLRVFAGYAGWGPGQLEGEIDREDWILGDAVAAEVFTEAPGRLWSVALERKGGTYALLARMPEDPNLN